MLILLIHFKKLKYFIFVFLPLHNFEQILEQIFSHKNIIRFQEILYW